MNFTLISEHNSLRVSFSQSRLFETTETLSLLVYFFTPFEFLDNPKLKGYVYDNIVLLRFCSTDHGHGHGRLAEVKIWNAVSSLGILVNSWTVQSTVTLNFNRKKNSPHSACKHSFFWRTAYAQNVRYNYPYRQYTNLFIFQFVFEHCFRCTLHLFHYVKSRFWYRLVDHTFVIQHTLRTQKEQHLISVKKNLFKLSLGKMCAKHFEREYITNMLIK